MRRARNKALAFRTALVSDLKAAIGGEWMGLETEAHGVTGALHKPYSTALALNQSGTRDTADTVYGHSDALAAAPGEFGKPPA